MAAAEYAEHEAETREAYRKALAHERAKADPGQMVYYMRFGDRVRMEAEPVAGCSPFGAIDQRVVAAASPATRA